MLKSLDHPHIVRVFEVQSAAPNIDSSSLSQKIWPRGEAFESTESLHIVMDYAEGRRGGPA